MDEEDDDDETSENGLPSLSSGESGYGEMGEEARGENAVGGSGTLREREGWFEVSFAKKDESKLEAAEAGVGGSWMERTGETTICDEEGPVDDIDLVGRREE